MKKLSKKILTVLLALALVVSVVTVAVLAAAETAKGPFTLKVDATVAEEATDRAEGATFKTLAKAVEKAKAGDTIELTDGIKLDAEVTLTEAITLDLNGKTITLADGTSTAFGSIVVSANATIKNGTITSTVTTKTTPPRAINIKETESTAVTLNLVALTVEGNNGFAVCGDSGSTKGSVLNIDAASTLTSGKDCTAATVGNYGNLTINVSGTVSTTGQGSAVYGGYTTNDTATTNINVKTGAEIIAKSESTEAEAAGILMMSNGKVTVDGTVTGQTGISMTLGELVVNEGAVITGTGTYNATYTGSLNGVIADTGAAIYVDPGTKASNFVKVTVKGGTITSVNGVALNAPADNTSGRNNGNLTLSVTGGTFKGKEGAVNVVTTGVTANKFQGSITGGFFSKEIDKSLLSAGAKFQLESSKGFSYYTSSVATENAKAELGGKIKDLDEENTTADIVAAGFLTEADNDTLNDLAEAAKGTGEEWSKEITDCVDNTFYAAFSGAKDDAAVAYVVVFECGGKNYTETVSGVSKGGIVYFTPSYQSGSGASGTIPTEDFQGEFTVKLYKGSVSGTPVSECTIDVYRVDYVAETGVTGDETTVYVGENGLDAALADTPDSFTLNPDVNKWSKGLETSKDGFTYTVKIGGTYASPIDPGHTCPTKKFKDMALTDTSKLWCHVAMDYMVLNGYINGFPGDTLQPYGIATRAQMLVIMAQTKSVPVAGDPWYKAAVDWAKKNDYSDGDRPDDPIQREEIVTILWKIAGQPKADTKGLEKFPDAASVNDWAKTAMAWAVEKGIMHGRVNEKTGVTELIPQGCATRAELSVFIYNYITMMK